MDAPSEHSNAIQRVRKEINRLTLEQAQALQDAIFMGMSPDQAKDCDARLDKIVELIDALDQLESAVRRLN